MRDVILYSVGIRCGPEAHCGPPVSACFGVAVALPIPAAHRAALRLWVMHTSVGTRSLPLKGLAVGGFDFGGFLKDLQYWPEVSTGSLFSMSTSLALAFLPPEKTFSKYGSQRLCLILFQKINLTCSFSFDAHLIEDFIVLADAERVEIFHHDEIFADVAALEFSGEEVRHEPADDMAARGNDAPDEVELGLVNAGNGNVVSLRRREDIPAMTPFVIFDLLHGRLFSGYCQRGGVADVGEGGGLLGKSRVTLAVSRAQDD